MARVYHDRKMLKWLPFEALEPQREALREVLGENVRETMPALSDDQAQANQYRLEEAMRKKEPVRILYFDAGARHTLFTRIMDADALNREIRTEDGPVRTDRVIEID